MKLPEGRLLRAKVVDDPRDALAVALDREVTGYAVLEPQETLLLDAGGRGVLTFRAGVPVLAYDAGTDRGGPAALAALAAPGPYRVELYAADREELAPLHEARDLRVPPGMPAERLAGDPALAASTRRAAPDDLPSVDAVETAADGDDPAPDRGAVEAFLADEEKIAAIRERAREEAERRAAEWGLE
ncbi:MAG: hypothetical protein ABEJ89_09065 [Haloarculaceae archaeon]